MDFRRINNLPPYVFTVIDQLKKEGRARGDDVIDLGFGNPDIPSPKVAVDKLCEAVQNPRNHRYSLSRGLPKLRQAAADMYSRKFNVTLDPETEVIMTIGAKEGLSHLMWVLVGPGDTAMVPTPSYPIHIYAPLFAGADVLHVRVGPGEDFFANAKQAMESKTPKPRVLIMSFPHNPTTTCVDLEWMKEVVAFAKEHDLILVHDFAYSDTYFDGQKPPSIMEVEGAKDVAVEFYTLTKSYSMAGWRMAFMVGNPEIVAALGKLKSYLDYGTFQPIQIAATVALNDANEYPAEVNALYQSRRDALCEGLNRIGWPIEAPKGTMFVWAPLPEPYKDMGSLEFAKLLVTDAHVAVSPGMGFGLGGEGFARFALIENEQRIHQAVRNIKKALPKLG